MRQILWFSIVLVTGLYICGPLVDPDLWWHITVGKWILGNQSIPSVDYWNLFAKGEPWRAYSWLSEIIAAAVDGNFGIHGLMVLKILLAVLISFSLFYCLGRLANDWFFGSLLGIFTTCACFNHFTLRPQSLVWIFLIWLIYFLDRLYEEGFSWQKALGVFVIFVLWANTHITTLLGLVVIVGWLFGKDRLYLKILGLAFLATFFTPYLGGEWLTFIGKTNDPFAHRSVAEFQPATIMQFSTAFLVIICFFFLSFLHFRHQALSLVKLMLAGAFILAALAVVKFLPFAVIVVAALLARLWCKEEIADSDVFGNLPEALKRFRNLFDRIPQEGLSFVCLCVVAVALFKLWQTPLSLKVVPKEAVDFMQAQTLPHPILNDFGKGGYMMYRYSDAKGHLEHPVPIDGRTNVTPHEVWEAFHDAFLGKYNWQEYLDLVKPQTILWRTGSALSSILVASGKWCVVFRSGEEDSGYLVLLEKAYYEKERLDLKSENCGS